MEFCICSIFPDTSGVVFDTRSKMVMSQGGTAERMKEKVRHNSIYTHTQACGVLRQWLYLKHETMKFVSRQEA